MYNVPNQVLTNVFTKSLITNSSAPKFAKLSFAELVSATVLSRRFQKAVRSANSLFGIDEAVEAPVKRAKRGRKATKKHAKVSHAKSVKAAGSMPSKAKRGRPLGSKNKPKTILIVPEVNEPAQSQPLFIDADEVETEQV